MPNLAIRGGAPAVSSTLAKTNWPIVTEAEKKAVMGVLDRGVLWAMTHVDGLYCPEQDALEKEFADFLGVRHVIAVNGGTAGIHMALVAAGVEAGDEVITPAFSFLATPAAILHAGAIPVFADIDPLTWNIDPAQVEAKITPRTKAILAVDIHGPAPTGTRLRPSPASTTWCWSKTPARPPVPNTRAVPPAASGWLPGSV